MSPSDGSPSPPVEPFDIHLTPQARAVLEKAPRRSRTAITRRLEEAARLAALRQWMHTSEGEQPIQLQFAGYELTYSLDPNNRRLTLWHLLAR